MLIDVFPPQHDEHCGRVFRNCGVCSGILSPSDGWACGGQSALFVARDCGKCANFLCHFVV